MPLATRHVFARRRHPPGSTDGESAWALAVEVSPSPESCGRRDELAKSKILSQFHGVPCPTPPSPAGNVKPATCASQPLKQTLSGTHTFTLSKKNALNTPREEGHTHIYMTPAPHPSTHSSCCCRARGVGTCTLGSWPSSALVFVCELCSLFLPFSDTNERNLKTRGNAFALVIQ